MVSEQPPQIPTQEDVAFEKLTQVSVQPRLDAFAKAGAQQDCCDAVPAGIAEPWQADGSPRFGARLEDLAWIDTFAANIHPYVRVRLEDGVLIKMPMEVFQLNQSGLQLLQRALEGEPIQQLAEALGATGHPERLYQIHTFFCDVRDLLQQRLGDGRGRPTTHVTQFQGSFIKYPVLSEIAVTYRCNLACSFCYAGCGTPDASPGNATHERHRRSWKFWRDTRWWQRLFPKRDPLREEMTADEVIEVIDQLALAAQVPSVSFTGGECTLRKELPQFIAHARHRGMRVNIITNGVLCSSRDYVDSLVAAGLTSAQVSLSGPNAAIHDSLARRPGAFDKAIQGIKNLRDAGLHVHTNTTICEENAEHLSGIIDIAQALSLPHVSMNMIIPTGTPNLPRNERLKVSYSRIGSYVLQAKDYADQLGVEFHWYSPTPFCIFNPIQHALGNKGCAACDGLVHISPSGEVLPCSSFARGVGNVLQQGFADVWFGKDAQFYKQKRQAHAICRGCEHFALCQGACTLYWSSMGYEELIAANETRVDQ